MSFPHQEVMDHIPVDLRRFTVDSSGSHLTDPLARGFPFHLDPPGHPYGRLHFLRAPLGDLPALEPAFIRKRNERERDRVRCVNVGYARLRERLPPEFEDKRLSKVETLRAAILYIRHLQGLLGRARDQGQDPGPNSESQDSV